jgi:chemotaxis protein MotB
MMMDDESDFDDENTELELHDEEGDADDVITLPPPSAQDESEEESKNEFYGSRRRRAPSGERREPTQLWLISYSDFMTILFIFFLVMYGYAVLEKQRIASHGASISYDAFVKLMNRFEDRVGSDNVEVSSDQNKVTLQLKDSVLFDSGKADLTQVAKSTLSDLAQSLKLVPGDVVVQGHTDNVPIAGGRYKSNWELSAARAFSVIDELTRDGIETKRLAAWGFGENRPIASNESEVGRRQNRRIEVIIFKSSSENSKGV